MTYLVLWLTSEINYLGDRCAPEMNEEQALISIK